MAVKKAEDFPMQQAGEHMTRRFIHTKNLMLVIADFSGGPWPSPMPFHSHPHEQVSCVADGEIILFSEDEPEQHLKAGDLFSADSGKKHTIQLLTKTCRIIDAFHPVREEFL
ncbi:cupin domain-containing protein [bacterium]|nr:cupin domain-containing protein [bacterium]